MRPTSLQRGIPFDSIPESRLASPLVKPILVIEQEHSLAASASWASDSRRPALPYRSLRAWDERIEDVDVDDIGALIPMGGNAHAWDEDAVRSYGASACSSKGPWKRRFRCSESASAPRSSRALSGAR
jgi:hypothetical protein